MWIRILNSRAGGLNAAAAQFGMSVFRFDAGEFNGVLDCYEDALRIFWEGLDADHVDVAHILNNIVTVLAQNGE